ncbi:hypothetical protein [Methylobrevis pamukkalensis]|uniref:Uncharacterized protein n=1 Tax=Methylobrevis pamukkalensis TaxID=1439726 RepID=A0A1E3GWF9_9HYPH|nr:hypothetical protein [Methylobrevis pamukkalensis]ODN68387.1 hypothetical protein A6302_04313 [Methylobrevis pamukkalensis]
MWRVPALALVAVLTASAMPAAAQTPPPPAANDTPPPAGSDRPPAASDTPPRECATGPDGQVPPERIAECEGVLRPPQGIDPTITVPAPKANPGTTPVIPPGQLPPQQPSSTDG